MRCKCYVMQTIQSFPSFPTAFSQFSDRLLNRKLFKCYDIRAEITHKCDPLNSMDPQKVEIIEKCCASVVVNLQHWQREQGGDVPRIITDVAERKPYKASDGGNGNSGQIYARTDGGRCCTTQASGESHCESMSLKGRHDEALTRPLPHDELVQLVSY